MYFCKIVYKVKDSRQISITMNRVVICQIKGKEEPIKTFTRTKQIKDNFLALFKILNLTIDV